MMNRWMAMIVGVLMMTGPVLEAQTLQNPAGVLNGITQNTSTSGILNNLHSSNQTLIKLAEIVASKTNSPTIKNYAQKLISGHQAADQQVTRAAQKTNTPLNAPTLSQNAPVQNIQHLQGQSLDKSFLQQAAENETRGVASLKAAQNTSQPSSVQTMAKNLLPSYSGFLSEAQSLLKKIEL